MSDAKSKVAPIKSGTIPRLEHQAVKSALEVVLAWLKNPSSSYVTFVANRVAAILELTYIRQLQHVPSNENPADSVSRGISHTKLKGNIIWFFRSRFLRGGESLWRTNLKFEKNSETSRQRWCCQLQMKEICFLL